MIGRGKVDSILKYDALGFDMDHTYVRYKMRSFIKLVYHCTAIFLVNKKGYPQEVFPIDDEDAKTKFRMYFRAVFDHKTGHLLKIGANHLIMRGYHGLRQLTREEIIATYGKNPIVADYGILSSRHPDFTNLHEYYGVSQVPVIAQIVELKASGHFPVLNNRSYYEIMADIVEAGTFNFAIPDFEAFKRRDFSGYFFPKFLSEPRHYVHKISAKLLERLQAIRAKGAKVFIASNNYYEVADFIMKEAIGPDWLDHFDFVIFDAAKPSFFHNTESVRPFQTLGGEKLADFDAFMTREKRGEEKVLIGGHASFINNYMKTHVKPEFKVLFFGDTIVTDCVYAFDKVHDKNWDIVLIMEELQELEHGAKDREYYNYWSYWGSALQDKNIYSGVDKTIVFDFADNIAHRSFSLLDSEEALDFLAM